MKENTTFLVKLVGYFMILAALSSPAKASRSRLSSSPLKTITLLHTNDLHSHFRPDKSPLQLGGVARLKTLVDRLKRQNPSTLLLDGGDWSEGDLYYTESCGLQSIQMMNEIGYDAAVIGNHDWINGPDILLDTLEQAHSKVKFLSENLKLDDYPRKDEFRAHVQPYFIQELQGIKIAFIGLSTYEFVFDSFFAPIQIREPFLSTRNLAKRLKEEGQADVIVLLSHNSNWVNEKILRLSHEVDLIIGAHDHVKLTEPIEVRRSNGRLAWLVEAGSWGRYLGKVDLTVEGGTARLQSYRLLPIDGSIPEDPQIAQRVFDLEQRIEGRLGPLFSERIGESQVELARLGQNNSIGNLVTDAYLQSTHADFAMESTQFIYGGLHEGEITRSDIFQMNPAVYNPVSQKSWSVKLLPLSGRTLKWILSFFFSTHRLGTLGLLNTSGLSLIYDPIFSWSKSETEFDLLSSEDPQPPMTPLTQVFVLGSQSEPEFSTQRIPPVAAIRVQGQPLELNRTYRMATGGGLIEALQFLKRRLPRFISLDGLEDTGLENWRVTADHIQAISPLNALSIPRENRIQTQGADLSIFPEDLNWTVHHLTRKHGVGTLELRVKNYGATRSQESEARVRVFLNQNSQNDGMSPHLIELGEPLAISPLDSGETQAFVWKVQIPKSLKHFQITAKIEGATQQTHQGNLETIRWFSLR
ncbi:MAG: bifunctional metallophosphatase/5'-nucleotidase [Bdellovibrionia bacterium]